MRQIQPVSPARDTNTVRSQILNKPADPALSSDNHAPTINEDRWKESQLEDPERWDGMS